MPNFFPESQFLNLKRVQQITSSHCGPAVIEMLLSYIGTYLHQELIVQEAGIGERLKIHGMTVGEMAGAVGRLAPQTQFWFKQNSHLSDLSHLVNNFKYPVGVEWQGVFFEDADEDNGHYGVITYINTLNNLIMLADPYKRFAGTDRKFHILEFVERWWDENEIRDPLTGKTQIIRDEHMAFVITPKGESFPESLGMSKA